MESAAGLLAPSPPHTDSQGADSGDSQANKSHCIFIKKGGPRGGASWHNQRISADSWPLLVLPRPARHWQVSWEQQGEARVSGRFQWAWQDLGGALAAVPRARGCRGRAGTWAAGAPGQVCAGRSVWDPRADVGVCLRPGAHSGQNSEQHRSSFQTAGPAKAFDPHPRLIV